MSLDATKNIDVTGSLVDSWTDEHKAYVFTASGAARHTFEAAGWTPDSGPCVLGTAATTQMTAPDNVDFAVGLDSFLVVIALERKAAAVFQVCFGNGNSSTGNGFRCFITSADNLLVSLGSDAAAGANPSVQLDVAIDTPTVVAWCVDRLAGDVAYGLWGQAIERASLTGGSVGDANQSMTVGGGNGGVGYRPDLRWRNTVMVRRPGSEGFTSNEIAQYMSRVAAQAGIGAIPGDAGLPEQVFATAGQSNMTGGWNLHPAGTQSGPTSDFARGWNTPGARWEVADGDIYNTSGDIGQVLASFAFTAITTNSVVKSLGFVPAAISGSAIATWLTGQTNYTTMLSAVNATGRQMNGFVWWQGEGDPGRTKAAHLADLETLYANVQADMGPAAVPFYVFDLFSDLACGGDTSGVRQALAQLVTNHSSNATLITTSDLVSDDCHAPWTGGYEIAGQRLYTAVFGS